MGGGSGYVEAEVPGRVNGGFRKARGEKMYQTLA